MRCFELNAKAKTLNIHQIQGQAGKHSDWCWHVDGSSKSALRKRDGNGDVSCPCDYYVCQLWATSEYLLKQDEAVLDMFTHCGLTLSLVQLYFQYLDVWAESVRMGYSVRSFRLVPV